MDIEAIVEEWGVLHVPLPQGTPVTIQTKKLADYTREERAVLVNAVSGSIPDLERPKPWPTRSVEPLD